MLFSDDVKIIYNNDNRQLRLDNIKNDKLQRFMDARMRYYKSLLIELKIINDRKRALVNAYVENVKGIDANIEYEKRLMLKASGGKNGKKTRA